jgi:hypothetical protein
MGTCRDIRCELCSFSKSWSSVLMASLGLIWQSLTTRETFSSSLVSGMPGRKRYTDIPAGGCTCQRLVVR